MAASLVLALGSEPSSLPSNVPIFVHSEPAILPGECCEMDLEETPLWEYSPIC